MKYPYVLLAVTLLTQAPLAISEETVMNTPMAATTLKLADRSVSTFYTVDGGVYKVVIAFSTGPQASDRLIRQTFELTDGQSYRLSIGGYGFNEQASTINMTRIDNCIVANIVTCESRNSMKNCI